MAAGRRTVVKICGLSNLEDARVAHQAGADWLGFVVKGESPRRISPETAGEIAAAVGDTVAVAVMVAPSPDEALNLAERSCASRVQLHRVDSSAWPADFPLPITFAVPVAEDGSLTETLPDMRHMVILDAADPVRAGGTGRPIPWETARVVAASRPIFLAGGLGPENVAEALERVRPFGVDATSRLEREPSRKDADKVRRFVSAVRACDERLGE